MDPIYFSLTRLQYLNEEKESPTILRVRLTRYKGYRIVLSDGTVINKNDLLIKIHLHNVKILRRTFGIKSEIKKAIITYKLVKQSLPYLATYVQEHVNNEEIKGVIGITVLNRGTEKLGFEKHPIKNRFYKKIKQLIQYPIYLLSHSTTSSKNKPYPVYVFMSKEVLLKKYSNYTNRVEGKVE